MLISIGRTIKAHGIRGEVLVDFCYQDDHLPSKGCSLTLCKAEVPLGTFCVAHIRDVSLGTLLRFDTVSDRTAAEALVPADVCVDESALPPAEDGTFYHYQVIGMTVVDTHGAVIGKVRAIYDQGLSAELLEIWNGERSFDLPFVSEYIVSVNPADRVLVIDRYEGLMGL